MSDTSKGITGAEYSIGAAVAWAGEVHGELSRVIIDPVTRTLTHLVVQRKHRPDEERLVPIALVAESGEQLRLSCSESEFDLLESAVEMQFLSGAELFGDASGQSLYWPYYSLDATGLGSTGLGAPQPVIYDRVPLGEVEIRRGEHVHAIDGAIGRVQGLVIDPRDQHVTHVLLEEGHLWGKKEVAIPITAVTGLNDGVRISLTTDQVRDLPPVHIDRPAPD